MQCGGLPRRIEARVGTHPPGVAAGTMQRAFSRSHEAKTGRCQRCAFAGRRGAVIERHTGAEELGGLSVELQCDWLFWYYLDY